MLAIDAVEQAKSGHPGTPMALAPIGYVLYTRIMRHSPEHPEWPNRDRFVLSAGHASMLLYAMLYLTGYGADARRHQALPPARIAVRRAPRVRAGARHRGDDRPLGQGLAPGRLALGERMLNARLGDDVIDHHTFAIACDGDMQEGISSEAASLAGHLELVAPDRLLRRQPHLRSRATRRCLLRGASPSATRPTAGTSCTSARTST
jgi:transketolase